MNNAYAAILGLIVALIVVTLGSLIIGVVRGVSAYKASAAPGLRRDSLVLWAYLTLGGSTMGAPYRAAFIKGELEPFKHDLRKVSKASVALMVVSLLTTLLVPQTFDKPVSALLGAGALGVLAYLFTTLKKHQSELLPMAVKSVLYGFVSVIVAGAAFGIGKSSGLIGLPILLGAGVLLSVSVKHYVNYSMRYSHLMHAKDEGDSTSHGGVDLLWITGVTLVSLLAAVINVMIYK